MKPQTAQDLRRREIATIKVAQKQLGLDDDTYRAMLELVTGKRSAADLTWQERKKVLDHLKTKGFKIKGQQPNQAHKPLAQSKAALERKIGWQLGKLGVGWDYVYGKLQNNVAPGRERFELLTVAQMGDISSALERTIRFKP